MANQTPDIRILVGNRGGASASGESAVLIRSNLEKALSAGIKIKVGLDQTSVKALQTQLKKLTSGITVNVGQGVGQSNGKMAGIPFAGFKGATVSTKAMSQATAELTRAKVDSINVLTKEKVVHQENINAIDKEKLTSLAAINAKKQEAQAAKTTTVLLQEEVKQRRLSAEAKDREATASVRQGKALADASLRLAQFNSYLQTVNPKGLREHAVQIAAIRDGFSSKDPLKIKAATAGFTELKAAIKTAGYEGGNAFTYLESKIKTFATYLASSALTMGVISGVRNIISTAKELDGSLTDLRIVTGGTRQETQQLLSTYNQMAQELGSTTAKVSSSAVEWQRQGYSLADANTLIKDSMVLSIVGFIDETEAATALTAAMKGYKLSVDDAMSVVDKFTATDMVAASSAGTLAEALAKTAANAKLAGLSLDDVIAQLAVVNETMQESGEQSGEKMRLAA